MDTQTTKTLLTAGELAMRLRLRPRTVRAWARAGRIPAIRINPKILRFEWNAVLEALRRREASHARR